MAKKEFDNLTGQLKPDYPKPTIPSELEGVEYPPKPDGHKKAKLGWSDYWVVIKAVFRNEALNQLQGKKGLLQTALTLRHTLYLIAGVFALMAIVWGLKSIL